MRQEKFLIGVFDSEEKILAAAKSLASQKIVINDVYSPYPIHGIDAVIGIVRSRLPIVCFIAGLIGLLIALGFQTWVFAIDWPLIVGGKPFFALPAFIPVTFELTVLIAGLTTAAAFLLRSRLFPGNKVILIADQITNNHFVITIKKKDASINYDHVSSDLKKHGACEVREHEVEI